MRDTFIGYYEWSQDEFNALWEEAVFVFDTNTLLNIYRYKETTCDQFLETLIAVQARAWIPYHVAYEFHKNRRKCIKDQRKAYDELENELFKMENQFLSTLNKYKTHKLIDHESLLQKLKDGLEPISTAIDEIRIAHPDYSKEDSVLARVTEIFDGKIGEPLGNDQLETFYKEGQQRYNAEIPPGYKDNNKGMPDKFGDLIIWKEMIRKAKKGNHPTIFITSDNKEDWWLEDGGKTIGPRPELIQEFKKETGHLCYIYRPKTFIRLARENFELGEATPEMLSEIEEVRRETNSITVDSLLSNWTDDSTAHDFTVQSSINDLITERIKSDEMVSKTLGDILKESFTKLQPTERDSILSLSLKEKINQITQNIDIINWQLTDYKDIINPTEEERAQMHKKETERRNLKMKLNKIQDDYYELLRHGLLDHQ